jgi:hypothetical protein
MERLQPSPGSPRESGCAIGAREAELFLASPAAAVEPCFSAYDWLDRVVADGRDKLRAADIPDAQIETWDTACRIAFLLSTVRARNENAL